MITTTRIQNIIFWLLVIQCSVISVSIAAASISLALLLLMLLLFVLYEKKWLLLRTPVDTAFILYIGIEILTGILSENPLNAFMNAKRLLLIAIVYGTVAACTSVEKIVLAIRLIAGTIAALSILEIVMSLSLGKERLSVFQHYMTTGGLKMIAGLLIIPFILAPETVKRDRIFFTGALVPIVLSLILTNTRSSWLGFLAGVAVMGGLYYRKLLSGLIVLIALFFLFAPQPQIDRAKSIVDIYHPNNVGRVKMWTTGIEMWKDRPIFGFGDIDLYESYSRYRTPGIDEPAGHLHNNYIHLLVTLGTVGFAIVMFLFYKILQVQYGVFARNKNDALSRNVALGSLAIVAGFLVNGLFEWNFGDHEIMVFIWFTIGLSLAMEAIAQTEKQ